MVENTMIMGGSRGLGESKCQSYLQVGKEEEIPGPTSPQALGKVGQLIVKTTVFQAHRAQEGAWERLVWIYKEEITHSPVLATM